MVNYYRLIGAAYIAFGVLGVVCAVVFHIGVTVSWLWERELAFIDIPAIMQIALVAFLLLIPLPSIIGGFAIMKEREWAKKLILVLSIFYMLFFPIGTLVSILTILHISKDGSPQNGEDDIAMENAKPTSG